MLVPQAVWALWSHRETLPRAAGRQCVRRLWPSSRGCRRSSFSPATATRKRQVSAAWFRCRPPTLPRSASSRSSATRSSRSTTFLGSSRSPSSRPCSSGSSSPSASTRARSRRSRPTLSTRAGLLLPLAARPVRRHRCLQPPATSKLLAPAQPVGRRALLAAPRRQPSRVPSPARLSAALRRRARRRLRRHPQAADPGLPPARLRDAAQYIYTHVTPAAPVIDAGGPQTLRLYLQPSRRVFDLSSRSAHWGLWQRGLTGPSSSPGSTPSCRACSPTVMQRLHTTGRFRLVGQHTSPGVPYKLSTVVLMPRLGASA